MADPVDEFMALEHGLLTHRLRRSLAGAPPDDPDPEENRVEAEFERIWDAMSDEERKRLRVTRERRPRQRTGGLGVTGGGVANRATTASPAPRGYVIRTHALPEGIELSIPGTTPAALRRPAAHLARLILDAGELVRFPAGARSALIESALALLGRTIEEVAAHGGLWFVDPETGEVLLADQVQPSGVAEPSPPPFA